MKKALLILSALTLSMIVTAQTQSNLKEVGLVFSNFDNFGVTFRIGTEKSLWRFSTLYTGGNKSKETGDNTTTTNVSNGFGLGAGREYRFTLAKNLEFRYGGEVTFTFLIGRYTQETTSEPYSETNQKVTTYSPGIRLVGGLNYVIRDKFVVGAEILPYFRYTFGTQVDENTNNYEDQKVKTKIRGFSYGLSNSPVLLSFIYRF